MPGNTRQLTVDDARAHLRNQCLTPSPTSGRVGLECEWHVVRAGEPVRCGATGRTTRTSDRLRSGPLPGGSAVTYEPGGQLELSGPALGGPIAAASAVDGDGRLTSMSCAVTWERADIALVGTGVDALRSPQRQLCAPRYDAMEAYFDSFGHHGRTMMTRTAALQINIDNGRDADEIERRWRRVHVLGPTLVAAFANSPTRLWSADWLAFDAVGELVGDGRHAHRAVRRSSSP